MTEKINQVDSPPAANNSPAHGWVLDPALRKRSLFYSYVSSIAAVVGVFCVSGSVMNLAALKLHADEFYLGVLNAFFLGPMVLGIFTMKTIHTWGKRKVMFAGYLASLIFIPPLILVPWLTDSFGARFCLGLILVCAFFRSVAVALGFSGWFPILQDIVPPQIVGRYFGALRTTWQIAGLLMIIFSAWFLGHDPAWWRFEVIFAIGFLGHLARALTVLPIAEAPPRPPSPSALRLSRIFRNFFAEPSHRNLVVYIAIYSFASTIAEPFKIKMLKDFGFSDGFILAAYSMINVGAILSLPFWGRLADRFGNRALFTISDIGIIIVALCWLLIDKNSFSAVLVFFLYFFYSVFVSGNGIAQTRYIIHKVSDKEPNYMNIIMLITNLSWGIAPFAGGLFLSSFPRLRFQSGALDINNYHILYLISALLLVIPFLLRKKLKVQNDPATSEVLAFVTRPVLAAFGPFVRFAKPKNKNHS